MTWITLPSSGGQSLILGSFVHQPTGVLLTDGEIHGLVPHDALPQSREDPSVVDGLDRTVILRDPGAVRDALEAKGLGLHSIPAGVPVESLFSSFSRALMRRNFKEGGDLSNDEADQKVRAQWSTNRGLVPITPYERQLASLGRSIDEAGLGRQQDRQVTLERYERTSRLRISDTRPLEEFAGSIRTYAVPGQFHDSSIRFPSILIVDYFDPRKDRIEPTSETRNVRARVYMTCLSDTGCGHYLLPLHLIRMEVLPNGNAKSDYILVDQRRNRVHEISIHRSSDGKILEIFHNRVGYATHRLESGREIKTGTAHDKNEIISLFGQAYVFE